MATLIVDGANGHHSFTLTVIDKTPAGTFAGTVDHNLSYTFQISRIHTSPWSEWGSSIKWEIGIGNKVFSDSIPSYDGSSTVTLDSGDFIYTQTDYGTVTLDLYIKIIDNANGVDNNGFKYTPGSAFKTGTMELNRQELEITFYYDSNGGEGSMETQSVIWGEGFNILPNKFTRLGYKFIGWNLYRQADNKFCYNSGLWATESELVTLGYEKGIYSDEAFLYLNSTFTKGCPTAAEFTWYAVWEYENDGQICINQNGAWKRGVVWINNKGVWKKGIPWIKENGIWKK